MARAWFDEELWHLTHLLLEAPDAAGGIALICLQGNHRVDQDKPTITEGAHASGQSQHNAKQSTGMVRLKPIERDIIAWVAAGKSYADIATILTLPYSTVRYHLGQARRRNGFGSVTQLVVRVACDFDMCPLQPCARRV